MNQTPQSYQYDDYKHLTETDIQNLIRIELSKIGVKLFRNNVGVFRTEAGDKVRTGLCPGSSDLIGWYKGIFVAIEVKRPRVKKFPEEQEHFIQSVIQDGGIAFFAKSPPEALEKLNEQYQQRIPKAQ
jgi:hypothetical protein